MTSHARTSNMILHARTAADLMTENPISIEHDATIHEALALFAGKGFNVAPVIDDAGHPVGVLSSSDILIHDQERSDYLQPESAVERYPARTEEGEKLQFGFHIENLDQTLVRDLMTPAVFAVPPDTPVDKVIADMLGLRVHHLFVVDDGILVGVISALDFLRHLRPEA